MKNRKRLLSMILAVMIIMGAAGTALGAGNYITKKIWQGPITMYKNSQQVQLGVHPIIMDGTTYVPVRAMAQLMGMNVTWDGTSRSIFISDNTQANMAYYAQVIASHEAQVKEQKDRITKLEAEKAELQKKLDEANKKIDNRRTDSRSASDLEHYLNRNYDRANIDGQSLVFDYTVTEKSSRQYNNRYRLLVEVSVRGNTLDRSLRNSSEFISFLERGVVYEIRRGYRYDRDYEYDYDDIDIEVTDRENRRNDCSFYVDSRGNLRGN